MTGSYKTFAPTAPARPAMPSRGRPLDAGVRQSMEHSFGHDFGAVRIHADGQSGRSASALGARAYTDRSDIVFGAGEYRPQTPGGRHLLAHELAHVVQLRQHGAGSGAEGRALDAARAVAGGERVSPAQLGSAEPGIHRQPAGEAHEEAPKPEFKPITLPWSVLAAGLPELQPPSLLHPPAPRRFFDLPPLGPGASQSGSLPFPTFKPTQPPGLPLPSMPGGPVAPTTSPLALPPATGGAPAAAPDLPSRVGVADVGRLSLGLRFGLPVAPDSAPGTPPDRRAQPKGFESLGPTALDVSNYQFELLDMRITGKVPHGFDAVDKGDLAKAAFGIVSTYIAPDLIKSLAQKVSGKPGADWQLDLTVNGDFKGGGITFSMPTDKPTPRHKPAALLREAAP